MEFVRVATLDINVHGKELSQIIFVPENHHFLVHLQTKEATNNVSHSANIQQSMGGPNVNWKFYTDLTKERNSEELPQLLNIGSCGLHIVHGGLQKGVNESGWKLGHLMRSLWQLFHNTPARCGDC